MTSFVLPSLVAPYMYVVPVCERYHEIAPQSVPAGLALKWCGNALNEFASEWHPLHCDHPQAWLTLITISWLTGVFCRQHSPFLKCSGDTGIGFFIFCSFFGLLDVRRFSSEVPQAGSIWAVGKHPLTVEKRIGLLATKNIWVCGVFSCKPHSSDRHRYFSCILSSTARVFSCDQSSPGLLMARGTSVTSYITFQRFSLPLCDDSCCDGTEVSG